MAYQLVTFATLKTSAAYRMDNSSQYSSTELGLYINEFIQLWQLLTGAWRAIKTITTTSGATPTVFYAFNTAPNALLKPLRVRYNGNELQLESLFSLDQMVPNWQVAGNGTPLYWAPIGASHFAINPPAAAGNSLAVTGWTTAPVLVNDTDFIDMGQWEVGIIQKYVQHIAAFKLGGKEFERTKSLLKIVLTAAARENKKLLLSSTFREAMGISLDQLQHPIHDAFEMSDKPTAQPQKGKEESGGND